MTEIKIPWDSTTAHWPAKCVRIIESFGLPGGKYITRMGDEYMIFSFTEPEDALMAKLIIGG